MTPRSLTFAALLMGLIVILDACVVGPGYRRPLEAPVTLALSAPQVTAARAADVAWWRTFGDPELDRLIDRALASNTDVRMAVARVGEARALFHDTQLNLAPRITTQGAYSRSDEQVPGFTPGRVTIEQAELGFDAAWEIDLFGRVRHQVEAAKAEAAASEQDLLDVRITVAAEVARNYLVLRGAQARQAVAEQNAQTERDTLRLTDVRRTIGTGDPVDVESARARLHATEAEIPSYRTAAAQAAYRLAVLVGERPGALDDQLAPRNDHQQPEPRAVAIGDATSVLRHRPDVQAAERRLAAQTAQTGVAAADLFPRINVTGFVGFLSGDVSSLFKGGSQAWAASPTVTWPGLDLGGARARLRAQKARGAESLAAYDKTVLRAVEDLQNALTAYRERQLQVQSLVQSAAASQRAADLAHIRYKEGRIDFLRVLDAERTRLSAEDALTSAETDANVDVVAIFKALGGDGRTGA